MSWTKGFNCRGTSDYVTDGEGETYVLLTDAYPVTRNGVTFGYIQNADEQGPCPPPHYLGDRHVGYDRRIAGTHGANNGWIWEAVLRVDLPKIGKYAVGFAQGDIEGLPITPFRVVIWDTYLVTQLYEWDQPAAPDPPPGFGSHMDIEGTWTQRDNWPPQDPIVTQVFEFGTTFFTIDYGGEGSGIGSSLLAHLYLDQLPAEGIGSTTLIGDITTIA
jgi:hypothetical protein